jgi:hypothetical protein
MPLGASLSIVETYRAHAVRLSGYAAGLKDPQARAEFASLAAEWERLSVLAEWQTQAAAVSTL